MVFAPIPIIDPSVRHVGVSKLRQLNATKLKDNEETLVIQDNDTPLAVLLSYERFLIIQEQLFAVFNAIELLTDQGEHADLVAAFEALRAGHVRSLDDIEADLEKER